MKTVLSLSVSCVVLGLLASGCEDKSRQPPPAAGGTGGATLPAQLFLTAAPAGVRKIDEAKPGAKEGEPIILSGRVGGSMEPFVDGRAVFTLVGPGVASCADMGGEDHCKTPWDYCCESPSDIRKHSVTVQVVDADGKPLKTSIKGQHGVKELSSLVVVGTVAQVVEGGTVVINATGIFVEKP